MPIDAPAQLAALIRAQLLSPRVARADAGTRSGASKAPVSDSGKESAASPGLQQLIGRRVQALRPDDPQRKRKAFRIFLESVLAQQLNVNPVGAPGFDDLVGQVMAQMGSDPALAQAMDEAAEQLLGDSPAA